MVFGAHRFSCSVCHRVLRLHTEPGFGLPEIYVLLSQAVGRHVPASDAEADLVLRAYRDIGPLPRTATSRALARIANDLGSGRPIAAYLDALALRVRAPQPSPGHRRHRSHT